MTRELLATPLAIVKTRHIEWVYADRIPLRTGTILAGQGGIAKSTIISDIIGKATRGTLPGSYVGRPIAVGVISPEDDMESVLVPRLMAADADLTKIVSLSTVKVTNEGRAWTTLPNIGDDLPALEDQIREHGIKLLVVDPLVSIMSGSSISQSDVRRNFDPLSALAAELEFAVLAVAHFGKSGDKAGDRLSGSHAFRDIARSLIVAAVDEETGHRIVTVEKSNYSQTMPSDAYEIESVPVDLSDGHTQSVGRARHIGGSSLTVQDLMDRDRDDHSSLSNLSQQILDVVAGRPSGVGADEVATVVHEDIGKVRKYLNRAVNRGDIERRERGVFAPVSRGSSGSSGSSAGHIGHTTHISHLEKCPVCREPLHIALTELGYTTHPNCAKEAV
jgi:hypothetical protein